MAFPSATPRAAERKFGGVWDRRYLFRGTSPQLCFFWQVAKVSKKAVEGKSGISDSFPDSYRVYRAKADRIKMVDQGYSPEFRATLLSFRFLT